MITETVVFDDAIRTSMVENPSDSAQHNIESISLTITQVPYDSTKHTISRTEGKHVALINNYPVFGTDGEMPLTKLDKAELSLNGVSVLLNIEGMYNPNLERAGDNLIDQFYISKTYQGYVIRGEFSGGGMGYGFEWEIVNNTSFRTIITRDWKILDLDFLHKRK